MPSPNFVATGNINVCRFVKLDTSADNSVAQAGSNDIPIGISPEYGREPNLPSVSTIYAAQAGDAVAIYGLGEEPLLELGGSVTRGDRLISDSNGKGVTASFSGTNQNVGAIALSSGASGERIRVQVVNFMGK